MSETQRKLQESRYFLKITQELFDMQSSDFEFHLNAFVNATRNVTFVMQKEYSNAVGFKDWWENHNSKSNETMSKFNNLRNISLKERSIKHSMFNIKHDFGPDGLHVIGEKGPTSVVSDPIRFDEPIPKHTYVTVKDDNGEKRVKVKLVHDFSIEESYKNGTKQIKFDSFITEASDYLSKLEEIVSDCEARFGLEENRGSES